MREEALAFKSVWMYGDGWKKSLEDRSCERISVNSGADMRYCHSGT